MIMPQYSNVILLYCIALLILTLINTIGGSIRVKENFLDEVFNLISDVENENKDISGLEDAEFQNFKTIVQEEDTIEPEPELEQVPEQVPEQDPEQDPEPILENEPQSKDPLENLEGFSGDVWASWS